MVGSRGGTKVGGRAESQAAVAKAERMLRGARAAEGEQNGETALLSYINAAIHAGDALCLLALGEFAQGQDHREAVKLLRTVPGGKELAKHLNTVLEAKKHRSYDVRPLGAADLRRVARAAEGLVEEAVRRARGRGHG